MIDSMSFSKQFWIKFRKWCRINKEKIFETCLILGNAFSLLPQPPSANSFLLTAASLQHLLHTLTGFDPSTSHLSLGYRQGLWALGYGRRLMVRRF